MTARDLAAPRGTRADNRTPCGKPCHRDGTIRKGDGR
jgi:hypothetical protein